MRQTKQRHNIDNDGLCENQTQNAHVHHRNGNGERDKNKCPKKVTTQIYLIGSMEKKF